MLETIFWVATADVAIVIIISLICRATGTRLPEWVAGKRVARLVNNIIAGDPKRLDRLFALVRFQ